MAGPCGRHGCRSFRLVLVLCALSCLGMAFDGTSAEPLQVVLLAGSLVFAVLVVRSFFVRITVRPEDPSAAWAGGAPRSSVG